VFVCVCVCVCLCVCGCVLRVCTGAYSTTLATICDSKVGPAETLLVQHSRECACVCMCKRVCVRETHRDRDRERERERERERVVCVCVCVGVLCVELVPISPRAQQWAVAKSGLQEYWWSITRVCVCVCVCVCTSVCDRDTHTQTEKERECVYGLCVCVYVCVCLCACVSRVCTCAYFTTRALIRRDGVHLRGAVPIHVSFHVYILVVSVTLFYFAYSTNCLGLYNPEEAPWPAKLMTHGK